jgi:hypothetical protein
MTSPTPVVDEQTTFPPLTVIEGGQNITTPETPTILMPHDGVGDGLARTFTESACDLFSHAAVTGRFFRRGLEPVYIEESDDKVSFIALNKDNARSAFESVGTIIVPKKNRQGQMTLNNGLLTSDMASALLNCTKARRVLPEIIGTSHVATLAKTEMGPILCGAGYSKELKIWIHSDHKVLEVPVTEAVMLLNELLSEFEFTTPSDQSRAFASFITPMLHFGNWLPGEPVPVDVAEANESQSGKTYRQKIVAAIYNTTPSYVNLKSRGTGGMDESIQSMIFAGKPFIAIDNLKGKLDSGCLEQTITNTTGKYQIRLPHRAEVEVAAKFIMMISSNKAEFSPDMANRSSMVRINKRVGYTYKLDPLGLVNANPGLYLGCVVAVVKAWAASGCHRSCGVDHDFRAWAGACDWIVREIAGLPPLLDGHREAQLRTANPMLTALREIALAVEERGDLEKPLTTARLLEIAADSQIQIPGVNTATTDEAGKRDAARAMGVKLSPVFKKGKSIVVDRFTVTRAEEIKDRDEGKGTTILRVYEFSTMGAEGAQT